MTPEEIVEAIIWDLDDRRGLKKEWRNIDADIRAEIIAAWTKIIRDGLEC